MRVNNLVSRLVLGGLIIFLSACGEDNSRFVGLWVSDTGKGSIEFKANNDVVVIDNMGLKVTGNYRVENDYTIFLRLKGRDIFDKQSKDTSNYAIRVNYEIKGGKLKLTIEDEGEVLDYRRH